jgi:hypothetical protein
VTPAQEAIARFSLAFVLTQLLEAPIYVKALCVRRSVALGASAITHPIVWWVMPSLWRSLYSLCLSSLSLSETGYFLGYGVMAEGFAVLAEALYFRVFGVASQKALLWAIVANATSSLLGLVLRAATGWP